jgi:hypothetical protein
MQQSDLSVNDAGVVSQKFPVGVPFPYIDTVRAFGLVNGTRLYTVPAGRNAVVMSLSAYNSSGSNNSITYVYQKAPGDYSLALNAPPFSINSTATLYSTFNMIMAPGDGLLGLESIGGTITAALSVIEFTPVPNLMMVSFGDPSNPLVSGNNTIFTNSTGLTFYGINQNPGGTQGTPFTISAPGLLIVNDTGEPIYYQTSVTSTVSGNVVINNTPLSPNSSVYVNLPVIAPTDVVIVNCSTFDAGYIFMSLVGF